MTSVTGRIQEVKQPYGGYLPISQMVVEKQDDGITLHPYENSAPSLVGLAVDYLTRIEMGDEPFEAFAVSVHGMRMAVDMKVEILQAPSAMPTDLSDESITNAIILASFDSIFRAGPYAYRACTLPDKHTIENIRHMVNRCVAFFDKVGPVTNPGFMFEGGYTDTITAGDGDILTKDGLWDIKVYRGNLTSKQTLQLLVYWRMGLRSIHPAFHDIHTLGFYNPRKDEVITIDVANISEETCEAVDSLVIGYKAKNP